MTQRKNFSCFSLKREALNLNYSVMALLEVGEISSGRAAKILGVSRIKMIEMMNKWGISIFDEEHNLE
ncbi:UPF0175 family protein [Okeania sp. KiyG1]|uniref:UPF0175 family protein n=1 Tax=Okeania sp. KiyG1 TaxID=2720165 RepID=UPI001F1C68E2|nr:UPF0175 family protein [Okeania sp. KiyG1]